MSTIVTRSGKGSPLTHTEVDANFTNLNTDKYQSGDAVSFTTLTATGQTSLGGAAGSESLRVVNKAGADRYLQVQGGVGGVSSINIGNPAGAGGLAFYSNVSSIGFYSGGSVTNQQLNISHTSSAVNYVQVTGAATGGNPTVSAQGSDTNINLVLNAKGSASILFQTAGQNVFQATGSGTVANRLLVTGTATTVAPSLSCVGSDTNISQVFQSKGTGAIDLAAGSSGVNISNGGTVTAITRTATGTSYTSVPSVAISAPTTAGGVQATATVSMGVSTFAVANGGTGYTLNDVLTVVGGTGTAVVVTASAVSAGVVTAVTYSSGGSYTVTPTNPAATTGGTGTGCTLNITYTINNSFTITNAGSGYVEQPTVTFSGGGGSGAAAYATVGSGTVVRSLGSVVDFTMPGGVSFRVGDAGATSAQYWQAIGGAFTGILRSTGSTQDGLIQTAGTGGLQLQTNNGAQTQFKVSHTASAVNYVQVTGAATTQGVTISAQGSDSAIPLYINAKGGNQIRFSNNGTTTTFNVANTSSQVNYLEVTGGVAGSSPKMSSQGSDTNIDLALTPKGTGNVKFGTLTASADAPITGYITIKDSGGTVRKLAVIA